LAILLKQNLENRKKFGTSRKLFFRMKGEA